MHVRDGFLMSSKFENKVSESGLLSHVYEAGSNRLNQVHHPCGIYPSGNYSREELWIEGCQRILECLELVIIPILHPLRNRTHSLTPHVSNFLVPLCFILGKSNKRLSSEGYKELEKVHAFDNAASDRSSNHGFGKFLKGSTRADSKSTIDINLNEQGFSLTDGNSKNEDHLLVLPWLKPKERKG